MKLWGHRGASADAPENTLEAFELAVAQGADGIELDVQRCASGEIIVCHDPVLDRLAQLPWRIEHTPWWKLRDVEVGLPLGHRPARIPLLKEVLHTLPSSLELNVELKCDTVDDHGLTRATVEVIRAAGASDRVLVSSFNPFCLWRLAQLAPTLRRGYLLDPDRSFLLHGRLLAPVVSTWSVHPSIDELTAARVRALQASGRRLVVWTVDDPRKALWLSKLGVEACITNVPGRLRRALEGGL
jgi:glycerophosphoryl diester phosphodiesterase